MIIKVKYEWQNKIKGNRLFWQNTNKIELNDTVKRIENKYVFKKNVHRIYKSKQIQLI
jgi:catabolite regulation protein CreA